MFIQVSEDEHIALDTIASIYKYWDASSSGQKGRGLCYVVTTKRGVRIDVKDPVLVKGIAKLIVPAV